MKLIMTVLVAAGLAAASSAMATNMVVNGNFSTGNLAGWDQSGVDPSAYNRVESGNVLGVQQNFLEMGAVGGSSSISQLIPTLTGHGYNISFDWLVPNDSSTDFMTTTFGGTTGFNTVATTQSNWVQESFNAVATSSSTALQFTARNDPNWYYISNISVTAAPVPEIPVSLMLSIGLLVPLASKRLRARRQTLKG